MTRSRHVTPGRTAERIEKIRKLLGALQAGQLERDEVGTLLGMGPSGVRKYLFDLRTLVAREGQSVRLSAGIDQVEDFLRMLGKQVAPRRAKQAPELDTTRHIHIMLDDGPFKVRQFRGIPAPAPEMAFFYGMVRTEIRA